MGCSASIQTNNDFIGSNDFIFSYCIGKGGFGRVFSCMHLKSQEWLAIKEQKLLQVLNHKNGLKLVSTELDALRLIGTHPFITSLHFAFFDHNSCYLAFDLCCGGDLRYHMKQQQHTFNEVKVGFIILCIGSALHHIHSRGIIHRDIKPENILFNDKGYPLLTDFGVAFVNPLKHSYYQQNYMEKINYDELCSCTMSSGTRQYLAPEVFTSTHLHGPLADYWSLGVTAYELIYGRRPYVKHCPSNFIAFAEQHYSLSEDDIPLTFSSKRNIVVNEPIHERLLSPSVVTIDCNDPMLSKSTNGGNLSPCSIAQPMSPCQVMNYNYNCNNNNNNNNNIGDGNNNNNTILPIFLQTRLPQSSLIHGEVSHSCRKVISKLMDVRPNYRHTYSSLIYDKWFLELNLDWKDIDQCRANPPFQPNLKQVSLDICSRHMFLTSDEDHEQNNLKLPIDNSTADMLQSTLSRFRYISPEFIKYVPEEYLQKVTVLSSNHQTDNNKIELNTAAESGSRIDVIS